MKPTVQSTQKGKNPVVGFRCPEELRAAVAAKAAADERTVSKMIILLIYAGLRSQS